MSAPSPVSVVSLGLKIGKAVKYVDAKHPDDPKDALVMVIFSELGYPMLSLALVRGGERGIIYKTCVPHRSLHDGEPGYWLMPGEA